MGSMAGDDLTQLLTRAAEGDTDARDDVIARLYEPLRLCAERQLRDQGQAPTLQPTVVLNEAFMRLSGNGRLPAVKNRGAFLALATTVMRRVVVDHARRRVSQKRGGAWKRIRLSGLPGESDHDADSRIDVIALEEALDALARRDERQARIVELRFYSGLSIDEVARILDVSRRTVELDWRMAKAWLRVQLEGPDS